jgi:hypothetical protein
MVYNKICSVHSKLRLTEENSYTSSASMVYNKICSVYSKLRFTEENPLYQQCQYGI